MRTIYTPKKKKQKQSLPSFLISLGCFGVRKAVLEDNGLFPFFDDLDFFVVPAINSINNIIIHCIHSLSSHWLRAYR